MADRVRVTRSKLHLQLLVLAIVTTLATALVVTVSTGRSEAGLTAYDTAVLADHPVAFWASGSGTSDLTGHGHTATAVGGAGATALLPNGESARTYDGAGQYLTVPSSPAFSIPTTRALTWEAWIRPAVMQFAHSTGGYVDFMGKCASYSPSCEWEARMYNAVNSQNRSSRISAYAFNPTAGLGSAADWQPVSGLLTAGRWIHVVGEYQTSTTPSPCSASYPGTINIWVDGIKQDFASHAPTGCMSQYSVIPRAGTSPLAIGTMARDSWFQGAIGKVAIYPGLLSQSRISAHFTAMTGLAPAGSCASTCTLSVQPGSATTSASPTPTTSVTPAPTTSVTPTASTSLTATTALTASSPITATVNVSRTWSTGYCASVTISTTGPAVTSWTATADVRGRVTSLWGATWSQTSARVTMRSLTWNGVLSPTHPVTGVGFCATTA